jgi:hypothetical protein
MSFDSEGDEFRRLLGVIRFVAGDSVSEALRRARISTALPGVVEDINPEKDVIYVRNDDAIDAVDLYRGISETPGVAAMTRQGNTLPGEAVRAFFDGSAGATATHTGVESRIVLPFGATSGRRIVLDGDAGAIAFYDDNDQLVGLLYSDQWYAGNIDGAHVQLDPFGGVRVFNSDGLLTVIVDPSGQITLRDPAAGTNLVEVSTEGVKVLDPVKGQDIVISSANAGAIPAPRYAGSAEASPGTSHDTPAAVGWHPNDLEIRHVAAWIAGAAGANVFTPPTNYLERFDAQDATAGVAMAATVVTRQPAVPNAVRTFTSSLAGYTFSVGHTVVVRGTDAQVPTYRSVAQAFTTFTSAQNQYALSMGPPAGVAAGDVLVAFVSFGNSGGGVPSAWSVPDGWTFLGAKFAQFGTTTLATGVWYKIATASEPTTYDIDITAPGGGVKRFHSSIVAIQTPGQLASGADIKIGGLSVSRGIVKRQTPLTVSSAVFTTSGNTDFVITDVPLIAGRRYKLRLHTPYSHAAVDNANIFTADARVNSAVVGQIARFRHPATVTEEILNSATDFTVVSDGLYNIDVRVELDAAGAGGNLQFLGSADAPRYIEVADDGIA